MARKFKTGADLAEFVKYQINEQITVDDTFKFKPIKGICYMEIPNKTVIWSLLHKYGIKVTDHRNNHYWVQLV